MRIHRSATGHQLFGIGLLRDRGEISLTLFRKVGPRRRVMIHEIAENLSRPLAVAARYEVGRHLFNRPRDERQ